MFKSPLVVHQEGHSACRRPAATVFRSLIGDHCRAVIKLD